MTDKQYEELYCVHCDSQRCGDNPPNSCPYRYLRENKYCEDKVKGLIHCESCHEKCDRN